MNNVKLTVTDLKRQKDALRRFERYLPTLVLKKQYLQIEVGRVGRELAEKRAEENDTLGEIDPWVAVLGEDAGIGDAVQLESLDTDAGNVAGVDVPVFRGIRFKEMHYDLFATPLWMDTAVETIQRLLSIKAQIQVLEEQLRRLEEELLTTAQRVNLFEKVMIPQTRETIRRIQVFLSDQQTAAVVRGKIAKRKIAGLM
jgi:V/A-type H+-transporting ATPase subunit D